MTSRFLHVARSRRRLEDLSAALGIGWSDAHSARAAELGTELHQRPKRAGTTLGWAAAGQAPHGGARHAPACDRSARGRALRRCARAGAAAMAACADALDGDSDGVERLSHAELREGLRTLQAFLKDLIHSRSVGAR